MSTVKSLLKSTVLIAIVVSMIGCSSAPRGKTAMSPTEATLASIIPTSVPPTSTASPDPTPTSTPITLSTVPQNPALDNACRQTIIDYFAVPCGDWQALRALFTPSSQKHITLDSLSCDIARSRTLLQLISASEWWQQLHPDQPLPKSAEPTAPNEYVYYVEYTIEWPPDETPHPHRPDFFGMLMWMVVDENNTCKARDYGW